MYAGAYTTVRGLTVSQLQIFKAWLAGGGGAYLLLIVYDLVLK